MRRTVGRTASGLVMLACHPRPDVRGTIAKDNTSAGFVLSQEVDCVTIREDQVRKIEHKGATSRLGVDYLAQLVHIVRVKLTADCEHHRSAARAMNFQHRPVAPNAIARPFERSLNVRVSGRRGEARFRQW
jgi:hypothetical protein